MTETTDTETSAPREDGFDPPRKCRTPEAQYEIGQGGARHLLVRVRFPFDIEDWAQGSSAIQDTPEGVDPTSDADRLRRYEERAAERQRLSDLIHDQMEAVAADCYRVLLERDARIGEDRVDYGVRHARWRRTREGGRPVPAHVGPDHWSRKLASSLSVPPDAPITAK